MAQVDGSVKREMMAEPVGGGWEVEEVLIDCVEREREMRRRGAMGRAKEQGGRKNKKPFISISISISISCQSTAGDRRWAGSHRPRLVRPPRACVSGVGSCRKSESDNTDDNPSDTLLYIIPQLTSMIPLSFQTTTSPVQSVVCRTGFVTLLRHSSNLPIHFQSPASTYHRSPSRYSVRATVSATGDAPLHSGADQ